MTDDTIHIVQPTLPSWESVEADLKAAWANPRVTVGSYVRRFEEAAERRLGVKHAIAVSSCTSGLMLGVQALQLCGEVIIPPFTWTATGLCLLWNGVTPVMADILPGTYTLDPASVEAAITDKTTAIMPVTVFGVPPEIEELEALAKARGLRVLYDSAQGLGSTYKGAPLGGFGDVEVFSMSPTKVATSMEGGLMTTSDDALGQTLRRMRDYGKAAGGDINALGLSARQTELHGVVACHTFAALDDYIAARGRIAARYTEGLQGLPGLSFQKQPSDRSTTWNYFTVSIDSEVAAKSRDAVQAALLAQGIQTKRYFYPALHLQTVFSHIRSRFEGRLPVAEKAAQEGLALPLFSHMRDDQVDRVIASIRGILA